MSNRICGRCKSPRIHEDGYYAGSTFYKCLTCGAIARSDYFPEQTLFHRLRESPEALAPALVHIIVCEEDTSLKGWTSNIVPSVFETYEEAFAATVAKLKEVQ